MASGGHYFPVDYEDNSSSRLMEEAPGALPDEGTTRSSNNNINQDSKIFKCMSLWTFSLIVIGLSVMFLVGVCVGFYVRDLQIDNPPEETICGSYKKPEVNYEKLGSLHESVAHFVRGEKIREFVSEYGRDDPVTGSKSEERLADVVKERFDNYTIDSVDVEEHDVMVTSADPNRPNLLEVLDQSGRKLQDMVLTNIFDNSSQLKEVTTERWRHPHVVFSPAGTVQASLVYAHYGRDTDFEVLRTQGIEVKDRVVLLRLGKLSVADKVMNCESYGVQGIILYWEPQDIKDDGTISADATYIPYASAATYSTDKPALWKPSIPCQTISSEQAKILISLLNLANNSIPAPDSWKGSLLTSYSLGGQKSDSPVVRLSVFNKMFKQRIRSIISTIHGAEELDRYVIVGAPRSSLPGQPQDVVASTSILIQIAESFHKAYNKGKWKPRRGVKLISWGGAEFSNCGILHYIQAYHHLLDRRAVAYFDLSQLVLGIGLVTASIPPGLHQLILETTFDVPDPKNADLTLQMSWQLYTEANKNISHEQGIIPLKSYHGDKTQNPFLHIVGVPEVKLQYRALPGKENSVTAMTTEDLRHHYKYHVTVTHILVKSLIVMVDNELLPLNPQNEVRALQSTLWETSVLGQCFPDMEFLDQAVALCKDLLKVTEGFRVASNHFLKISDKQGIRMVNDIIMSMQQLFLVHKNGRSQHILYPALDDNSLTRAAELCEAAQVVQLQNMTREFEETLTSAVNRALMLFRFSA